MRVSTLNLGLLSSSGAGDHYRNSSGSGQPALLAVTPASCGGSWRQVLQYRGDLQGYSGAAALSTGAQIKRQRVFQSAGVV